MRAALRRTAAVALAIVAWLAWLPASALAQPAGPQIEIRQFGWQADGTLTARGWNPILLRVSGVNEPAARVQASLKLSVGSANQTFITPVAVYAQDVSLPAGASRDVKLWLPVQTDGAYLVTAQVLDPSGRVLAELSTTSAQVARADGAPLILTLADSPNLSAQLAKVEIPYQQGLTAQVRSLPVSAADVPTRAEYLAGFQGMVVQGAGAATLTAEQKRAIQQWVTQGGDLLIVGGADASRAAAVLDGADALGVRFGQLSGSTDLQPLAVWASGDPSASLSAGAAAQVQSDTAELLAGSREKPLAVRSRWGDGTVTLLAVDPTLDPLRGWSGTTALLKRALQPALSGASLNAADATRGAQAFQPRQDDSRLLSAVDALPSNAFPDWQHIALLLGGFALVVGPLLHLVLWRTGRRPWLWLAVPGLSLAVAAAISVVGVQPGHDVVANVVSEVRVDPITGDARQAMAVGFFAPLHDQLSVHIAGEVPVRVSLGPSTTGTLSQAAAFALGNTGIVSAGVGSYSGRSAAAALPGYKVVTGRDTQVEYTSTATLDNGLRSLVLSRGMPRGSFGKLEADLRLEGADGIIEGTVRNTTPYTLDEVGLAIGQTISRLGPMAPGQTASVRFDPRESPPSAAGNLPYSFAWQLFGVPAAAPRAANSSSPGLDPPGDPETRRRIKVVDAVFAPGDRSAPIAYSANGVPMPRPTSVRPMLVAVTSEVVGADVLPSVGAQRTFQESVIEVPVRLNIAPGPFTLSSSLMPPTVGVDSGASLNPGATSSTPWLDLRGAATYTFRADLPVNSHVNRLNVTTQQASGGPAPAGARTPPPPNTTSRGPSTQGTFSIYNWQTAAWEVLAAGTREVALSPAQEFIGPDGSVRIQVTSGGTDRVVRFLAPELTLEGEAGS
jgi:hypothetical protein